MNVKKSLKYSVIGGCLGGCLGLARIPQVALCALTAPVSYPLLGGSAGLGVALAHKCDTEDTVKQVALGTGVGIAMIPFAPLNFVLSPLQPITDGFVGAATGLVLANQ